MKAPLKYAIKAKQMGKKSISYSQVAAYSTCPRKWKLQKIDKINLHEPGIPLVFGTAMHETLQKYLEVMYTDTIVAANKLDLPELLKKYMFEAFLDSGKPEEVSKFISKADMESFYTDGLAILEYFVKHRAEYFDKKHMELVGIEMPIFLETEYNSNIMFNGFIDLVIKDGDKIKIIDIKTSYMGWKAKKKKAEGMQLRLYKKFFSEQYGTDIKDIEIEYFIIKRKIWEGGDFPVKRVQVFKPASGKPSINKADKVLKEFIETAFLPDGNFNLEADFPAYKDDCSYCPYKMRAEHCPPHKRSFRNATK